jgi:serine/threonine protein kinase/formylglycine-generating enzyme required for sulfatase activity
MSWIEPESGMKLGSFELLEEIGRGSMGVVYRARQESVGRIVAIKVLPPQLLHHDNFFERFQREVEIMARLEHPHIIPIYDYGQVENLPYIAMRYLGGGSLAHRLVGGGWTLNAVEKSFMQLCAALDYAHKRGVVHRDLKPANVMLDEADNLYLTDFGIARLLDAQEMTASGIMIGTPAYMCPEQIAGKPADARSDIYALGAVLFTLLTGRQPFEADNLASLLRKQLDEPLPSLWGFRPDIPATVDTVIQRATAKQPDARYTTADELGRAFAEAARTRRAVPLTSSPVADLPPPVAVDITLSDDVPLLIRQGTTPGSANVFISYARKDGSNDAERLYQHLRAQGMAVWRDVRDLDPYKGFDAGIEGAMKAATHVVVLLTPDVERADSFVRLEIAFALSLRKPIIPLVFPSGYRPISIINHTFIAFADWQTGCDALMARLKGGEHDTIAPETHRQRELAYLESLGQQYDRWRELYTAVSASTQLETVPQVRVKSRAAALHLMEIQHNVFFDVDHMGESTEAQVIAAQTFDELLAVVLKHRRVALIGDPGVGKTTTLERIALELAARATENEDAPLPVFVRLGGFRGGDLNPYIEESFGGLKLRDYPLKRVALLLDGLNETPDITSVAAWLQAHADTFVVVSCRKLDYMSLRLPLQRVDVAPLDVIRIHQFISNYLEDDDRESLFWTLAGAEVRETWLAWQRAGAGFALFWNADDIPSHPNVRGLTTIDQDRTWRRVKMLRDENKLPGLLGVVTNPFLLFATLQLYMLQGTLPANRGQLIARFVALLIDQRGKPAAVTRPPWIDEEIQRWALGLLAGRMQNEHTGTSVNENWALDTLCTALPDQNAEQLLYLAASAGIIEHGKTFRFTHQLLQEYFGALAMQEARRQGITASAFFPGEQWWQITGWEESALLLAGLDGNAGRMVDWLTPVQPTLAYRCATESGVPCPPDALRPLYEPAPTARICPLARAAWGHKLAAEGDLRPGVGLRGDGLPDIGWMVVPEEEFIYQQGERLIQPAFYIARYPVTQTQFQAFVNARDGYSNSEWWRGLINSPPPVHTFAYANHPCDQVSWEQAVAFCRWLASKLPHLPGTPDDSGVRLPTEHEWEQAARGIDGRLYPWGNQYTPGDANIDEVTSGVGVYQQGMTTAVGLYSRNISPYGAHDMMGNVWEWCLNAYLKPSNFAVGGTAARVLRGGSYRGSPAQAQTTTRAWQLQLKPRDATGFRVVYASPPIDPTF